MLEFQELYESYAADVYRFAFWLAGESAVAEDITSETFVRAWSKRNGIRTETLKAYLFTIARNIYLAHLRRSGRHVELEDVHPDSAPAPDEVVERRLELQRVQQSLQRLPETDRTAFIMRVQHGLPYTEIARALEISLTAAKVKVHRARRRLLRDCIDTEVL